MVISKDGVKITSYQYPINTCQTLTSVRRRGGFNQTIANPFSTRSLNGKRPNPNPNPALIVTLFSEQILWWMEPLKKRWCLLLKKKWREFSVKCKNKGLKIILHFGTIKLPWNYVSPSIKSNKIQQTLFVILPFWHLIKIHKS